MNPWKLSANSKAKLVIGYHFKNMFYRQHELYLAYEAAEIISPDSSHFELIGTNG